MLLYVKFCLSFQLECKFPSSRRRLVVVISHGGPSSTKHSLFPFQSSPSWRSSLSALADNLFSPQLSHIIKMAPKKKSGFSPLLNPHHPHYLNGVRKSTGYPLKRFIFKELTVRCTIAIFD